MNWVNVRLILLREIRDQLRDRRTLFMIAVLPLLLYPLLSMSMFQITQFMKEEPTQALLIDAPRFKGVPALVEGKQFAAALFTDTDQQKLIQLELGRKQSPEEARRKAKEGEFHVVIYFPPDFKQKLDRFREQLTARRNGSEPLRVPGPELFYNGAKERSQVGYHRVADVLDRWTEEVGRQNLRDSHMPMTAARPFVVGANDVAEAKQRKAVMWARILPFLLLIWALTGAFYPAIDLCAGEKERGTLETLLSSPAERSEIVWGKLLTVMIFSMATAVLNIASMGITGWFVLRQMPNVGSPPLLSAVWLTLALLPVSALFGALCLALAAFARSSKEGQYYLMPLVLITMPLTVLPMAPGVELNLGNSLIPLTGLVLLLRSLLEGNYAEALPYVPVVVAVTLACCLFAVRWAADQFNSESVLFRESERLDMGLWLKHLVRDREPTPTVAAALFCGVLILVVRFFMSFAMPEAHDFRDFAVLAAMTQLVVVLTPALLMTVMLTSSPRRTLLLRWPPALALPAAALLAIMLHPLVVELESLVMRVYPLNEKLAEKLKALLAGDHSLWLQILVIAVVPAVCEEIAFRGFLLSGLRRMGHKWRAIAISSVFFGVTHGFLQQSIIACLVGVVLGYLAVQSGSLLTCIVFHLVHNSMALVMHRVGTQFQDYPVARWFVGVGENGPVYHGPTLALATLGSLAILWWFRSLPYSRTPEEILQESIDHQSAPSMVG